MTCHEEMIPDINPIIILREEFDNWAILFNPDTNMAFGINPVGVVIWKYIDGRRTIKDIIEMLHDDIADMPEDAGTHMKEFIDDLVKKGLASYANL